MTFLSPCPSKVAQTANLCLTSKTRIVQMTQRPIFPSTEKAALSEAARWLHLHHLWEVFQEYEWNLDLSASKIQRSN